LKGEIAVHSVPLSLEEMGNDLVDVLIVFFKLSCTNPR
jgi:hypothetical protein